MACFSALRKQKEAEKVSNKIPQDFVPLFYKALRDAGLVILERPITLKLTDNARMCGGNPGDFIACETSPVGGSELYIEFLKSYWDSLGDDQKRCLAFHELGHALLRLPHKNGPAIMQEALMEGDYFKANETKLVQEMVKDFMAGGARV
jgi:hypothetical protein